MRDRSHLLQYLTASAALLIVLMLTTSVAVAEEMERADFADTIHVIQPKPVLQKGRFNLTPRLGMTINDAVYRNFKVGANANFHITERIYAGGVVQWYNFGDVIGGPTQTFSDVNAQTRATVDAAYLNWGAGAEIGFVPLFGKFAFMNRGIIFYDVALSAGAMFSESTSVSQPAARQSGPAGTVSISTRLFLNEWMAVNVEVRDVLFSGRVRGQPSGVLTHSVTLGAGMSFYFPMGFEYSDSVSR